MKIVLIVSNHLRHMAYVKHMCEAVSVSLVIFESKPKNDSGLAAKEEEYFGDLKSWQPSCETIAIEKGQINEDFMVSKLLDTNPDIIFTFGCSLLKKKIYSIPAQGCINIHTGLVQCFRGVDSSFWAIYKETPEAIGSTIHYINNSIDAGSILFQIRPELFLQDDLNDVFLKTCSSAFQELAQKANSIIDGKIKPTHLVNRGNLYQVKDMNEEVYTATKNKLKKVLKSYILNKPTRDEKIPLIC